MATVKHISSKNANLNAPLTYLTFEHDEKNGRLIHDDKGSKIPRTGYLIDGINCTPWTFGIECVELAAETKKNLKKTEVKTHQYIISFDPDDKAENGLTVERAQAIGMELAGKYFPGHIALVCTHPDGTNHSGNIHCHIVISSIRKFDIERAPYMTRPTDNRAGFKHRSTNKFTEYLKQGVMDICRREHLMQVDLLSPAKEKTSDREYRKKVRGQDALDKQNAEIIKHGSSPDKTVYETNKQLLRKAIFDSMKQSESEDEFRLILKKKHGIDVVESRGRWGYTMPDSTRTIRARQLGISYEKEYIISCISSVKTLIDVTDNSKAKGSDYYKEALEGINIQRKAQTITFLHKYGFNSIDELDTEYTRSNAEKSQAFETIKNCNKELTAVGNDIKNLHDLNDTSKIYKIYEKGGHSKDFYQKHASDITRYRRAYKYIKTREENGTDLSSEKQLHERQSELRDKKDKASELLSSSSLRVHELGAVRSNVYNMLGIAQERTSQREI